MIPVPAEAAKNIRSAAEGREIKAESPEKLKGCNSVSQGLWIHMWSRS